MSSGRPMRPIGRPAPMALPAARRRPWREAFGRRHARRDALTRILRPASSLASALVIASTALLEAE